MASNVASIPGHLVPNGYQQITSLAAATGLTVPDKTVMALIQPESQNVRWRDDQTNPTAAIGMILVANDILTYTGIMADIKFIEISASAKLNISYYKNNG